MNMRLDATDVLRRVIENPQVFPLTNETDVIARKLVVARLKEKTVTLADLKAICKALSEKHFKGIADGLTDAEAKAIVTRVDKENKEAKAAGGPAQRVLLNELATGHAEPRAKAIKERAPKKKVSEGSEAGKALKGRAMSAQRKR